MEVILRSKVQLLSLPRSKIPWIKTLPWTRTNPNKNVELVAKTMILTSENELRYFELEKEKKKEKGGSAGETSKLKVGAEWTHSFGKDNSVDILLVDPETEEEDLLVITKESSGLGFYTKSSSSSTLNKKGTDTRFSSVYENEPGRFRDHFAMGRIWCGVEDTAAVQCTRTQPRIGGIYFDQNDNSTSFYFLQKYTILDAPDVKEGGGTLFPLKKVDVKLAAEVEGPLDKIWIIPMPSSFLRRNRNPAPNSTSNNFNVENSGKKKSVNDVIVFQKQGKLFLFQLNESSQLIKVGDLKLPQGFPGMEKENENESEMTIQSLHLFNSEETFSLALTFKSMTVIFSQRGDELQFERSSFFYFDNGGTPLFLKDEEEAQAPVTEIAGNETQLFFGFLLDGPKSLGFSKDSLDFRPIPPKPPTTTAEINPPHLKVLSSNPSPPFGKNPSSRILVYEDSGAIFAALLKSVTSLEEKTWWSENGGIEFRSGVGHCSFEEEEEDASLDPRNSSDSPGKTAYTRKNLWDKSILDLIHVKQMIESPVLPNGQIQFQLPFIPLTGFSISYISNSDSSESSSSSSSSSGSGSGSGSLLLGHKDWSISSHPFVVRVRKSVFQELDKFYLILDSQPHLLKKKGEDSPENPDPGNENGKKIEFTAPTAPQYTKILYFSSSLDNWSESTGESYWEFQSKGATAFFGQKPKPESTSPVSSPTDKIQEDNALRFQYDARNRNWKVQGDSFESKFPVEWHLTRFSNHATRQTYDYNYRSFNPLLKNGTDSEGSNSNSKWNQIEPVALFISNVTSTAYKNPTSSSSSSSSSSDVNVNVNKLQLGFHYKEVEEGSQLRLHGYTMKTESWRQNVQFQYDGSNSKGKLTGIRQQFGNGLGSWRDMLKFSYSEHSESASKISFRPFETAKDFVGVTDENQSERMTNYHLLSAVELPSLKTTVHFNFTPARGLQLPHRRPEVSLGGLNVETAEGHHGFGFSVIALDNLLHFYKHTDGSVQTVPFAQAAELERVEKVKVLLDSSCAFLHMRDKDQNQNQSQVKIQAYCFTSNTIGKELNWRKVAEKIFSGSSSNRLILSHDGTMFNVQEDANKIWIYQWTEIEDETRTSSNPPPSHSWKSSSISIAGPPTALQLQGNFLSWLEISAHTKANTNKDKDKDKDKSIKVKYLAYRDGEREGWDWANVREYPFNSDQVREDCSTFFSRSFDLKEKDADQLWDFFHPTLLSPPLDTNVIAVPSCGLKSDGRTIQTVVDLLVLDETERVKSHKTFSIDQDDIQKGINLSNYRVTHQGAPQHTIRIGGKAKIFWDVKSSEWKLKRENGGVPNSDSNSSSDKVDLKLNENGLKLVKGGREDTLKIKMGGQLIKDLGVKNSSQLVNFFPEYMVTTTTGDGSGEQDGFLNLLEFPSTDKSVVKETRVEGETILPGLTSPQIFATFSKKPKEGSQSKSSSSSNPDSSSQLHLRTMTFNPQLILSQVTVEGGKYLERKTGYDYSDAGILANGRLIFGTRKVIPGAEAFKNGWMEYTDSFQGNPKIFDNRGNFIGRMQGRENSENSGARDGTDSSGYSLMDITETQQILDTHPYLSSECQVGYFGFQDYEKKGAGEDCPEWEFPAQNVISNEFPLTGRSFLRLTDTSETLSTTFILNPADAQDYTVSAWVRSPLIKLEDTISPILKVRIQGMEKLTWLSKIVLEEDGFYLLQINVLAHELDAYEKSLNPQNHSNSTASSGQGLEVLITISGQFQSVVDVDHILYAPSSWDSEITVFDPSTLRVTDRILGRSGLLSHIKFDSFENPLAQINSEGSVMKYEIRAPSPGGTNHGLVATTKFEVLGDPGWYESCDPSLKQSLTISNPRAWALSPGFAHHVGVGNHTDGSDLLFQIKDQESFLFRFTYDIDIGNDIEMTSPSALLYYKNLKILSIDQRPSSMQNTLNKGATLTFNKSLFSKEEYSNSDWNLQEIPPTSSISFALLMKERVLLWIGGDLKLDATFQPSTSLKIIQRKWKNVMTIVARGPVSFGDILILPQPKLTMTYSNILTEKIQEIEVVSKGQIRVGQTLYDELGRPVAVTKATVINVPAADPLLSFRPDFVTRSPGPLVQKSQSQSQRVGMDGEVSRLNPEDGGYPFTMVKYEPKIFLDIVAEEGRPGVEFSIGGRFQNIFSTHNPHPFIQLLFPESAGFQYRVSKTLNSQSFYEQVTVYTKGLDGSERTHAAVVISQTGKNLLATYDYDERGQLIAAHSPQFHTEFKTFEKGGSWNDLKKTIKTPNGMDPGILATFYKYDDRGRLVQKSSPDMGIVDMIYEGDSDKFKYAVHRTWARPTHIDTIMYYEYENDGGSLSQVGILKGFDPTASPEQVALTLKTAAQIVKIPRRAVKPKENSELANIYFKTDLIVSSFGMTDANSTTVIFEDYIELLDTKINTMNVETRTALFPTKTRVPALLVPTSFQYNGAGDKLVRINVPFQDYGILYRYDNLGQLSSISVSAGSLSSGAGTGVFDIANYEYNGSGAVVRERLHGFNKKDSLSTTISYNSPGYPTERQNDFIKESLSYEDDGYGDRSTGTPSSVMTTTTTRFWDNPQAKFYRDASDFLQSGFGVSPKIATLCYSKLEEFGYIKNETVVKMFHPKMNNRFPIACTSGSSGEKIQKVFTEKVLKTRALPVSFKYQYGPHRDLVKVKFVVEESEKNQDENAPFCSQPLTTHNFLEQLKLEKKKLNAVAKDDETFVAEMWKKLIEAGFLVRVAENGLFSQIHWTPGKSFFNPTLLNTMLKDKLFTVQPINMMMEHLASMVGSDIHGNSNKDLKSVLKTWQPEVQGIEGKAETLIKNLKDNGFISISQNVLQVSQNVFHPEFLAAFDQSSSNSSSNSSLNASPKLKGLVYRTLLSFFNCAVGSSPLDKQVRETDMNGNFQLFFDGMDKVELGYIQGTNRIKSVKMRPSTQRLKEYEITHDVFGNLNSAPHHKINSITYDEITAKPILMQLTDGLVLKFRYDHRGERVTKEVFGPSGALLKKIKYLSRDEHGRSLLEEEFTYLSPDIPPKIGTTFYIYNPDRAKGLVGFVRNGKLYNVFTDNVNSVRLVILDGHVVGAWDYFPYGEVMTSYIASDDASTPYRFSGQELDVETGLYNFHARIYDPTLGRFYQIDPEEQFFSPYKYAGNSPLNAIDPDGKFVFLAIFALTALGAYLGASTANNNWNPAKWKWDKPGTYLGLGAGALTGALIIPSAGASFAALVPVVGSVGAGLAIGGTTVGGAYLLAAAENEAWDPRRWDIKAPGTYNALFSGIALGIGLPSAGSSYGEVVKALSKPGQVLFIGATVSAGVGVGYLSAASANQNYAFWEWEFSNPKTVVSFGVSGLFTTLAPGSYLKPGKYLLKQHKIAFPGFQNVAKKIVDSLRQADLNGLASFVVFVGDTAKAAGKVIGTATAVGLSGYIAVAAANDGWIAIDWREAGTYSALINGMWGGWIGANRIRQGGAFQRRPVTIATKNVKPWSTRAGASSRKTKFDILTSKITNVRGNGFSSAPSVSASIPPKRVSNSGPISKTRPSPKSKLSPIPTSKLASLGNSKWTVFGFSGQGKGGIVYLNLNPLFKPKNSGVGSGFISFAHNHAHTHTDYITDQSILSKISNEKKKVQHILSFISPKDAIGDLDEKKQGFLKKLKSLFCDPPFNPTETGNERECHEKSRRIASALKQLTIVKLKDGTLGNPRDWELQVKCAVEWTEKRGVIKSLLQNLEQGSGISDLGDDLESAHRQLDQLQLTHPNETKYQSISTYITQDIPKAVQKAVSIRQKQGVYYQERARELASLIKSQIQNADYRFSLSNWASSNCGKAVVSPAISSAREILKLDQNNGICEGGVDYVAIYNPQTVKKPSRCSQCLLSKDKVDVEQFSFILTEEAWLTKIDGVDNAVFFHSGDLFPPNSNSNSTSNSNSNSTQIPGVENQEINLSSTTEGRGETAEKEEYDYFYGNNYDYADEPMISNLKASKIYLDVTYKKDERESSAGFSHSSSSSSSSHGGIIQSLHKSITFFLHKTIPTFPTLHFDMDYDFWKSSGKDVKSSSNGEGKSEKIFNQPSQRPIPIFHPVSTTTKSKEEKESGKQDSFSTRCLPFYSNENSEYFFGLSCSANHGQILVFYSHPQEQMATPPLEISGQALPSSSWNHQQKHHQQKQQQQHSFDKNSCQFLSSFHGQNAAFCEGPKSNILYIPTKPILPLDSLNDQLLLLLLAQHFLQNWRWFGGWSKGPDITKEAAGGDRLCPEEEAFKNSQTMDPLSPGEIIQFQSVFNKEVEKVKIIRETLISQLGIRQQQQEKEKQGRKFETTFLYFSSFCIEDLEEEFLEGLEKSTLKKGPGFFPQEQIEYVNRLREIKVEMEEEFEVLSQFGSKNCANQETQNENSMWNFVQGLFYSNQH